MGLESFLSTPQARHLVDAVDVGLIHNISRGVELYSFEGRERGRLGFTSQTSGASVFPLGSGVKGAPWPAGTLSGYSHRGQINLGFPCEEGKVTVLPHDRDNLPWNVYLTGNPAEHYLVVTSPCHFESGTAYPGSQIRIADVSGNFDQDRAGSGLPVRRHVLDVTPTVKFYRTFAPAQSAGLGHHYHNGITELFISPTHDMPWVLASLDRSEGEVVETGRFEGVVPRGQLLTVPPGTAHVTYPPDGCCFIGITLPKFDSSDFHPYSLKRND